MEVFKKELSYIKDGNIKENVEHLLNNLPDYFYEIPASSTGKYHPAYTLGDGGLVRHTKVVAKIGYELLNNDSIGHVYNSEEKDLLIGAMLLHDGLKSGKIKEKYTRIDHPLLVCEFIKENNKTLTDNQLFILTNSIESHMGQWNTDFNGNEVLPKPSNKYQRFVHMCDYLASRKFLNVEFENNNIVE